MEIHSVCKLLCHSPPHAPIQVRWSDTFFIMFARTQQALLPCKMPLRASKSWCLLIGNASTLDCYQYTWVGLYPWSLHPLSQDEILKCKVEKGWTRKLFQAEKGISDYPFYTPVTCSYQKCSPYELHPELFRCSMILTPSWRSQVLAHTLSLLWVKIIMTSVNGRGQYYLSKTTVREIHKKSGRAGSLRNTK